MFSKTDGFSHFLLVHSADNILHAGYLHHTYNCVISHPFMKIKRKWLSPSILPPSTYQTRNEKQ